MIASRVVGSGCCASATPAEPVNATNVNRHDNPRPRMDHSVRNEWPIGTECIFTTNRSGADCYTFRGTLLTASPSRVPIEDVGYGTRIATVVPSVTVNPRRFSTIGTIDRDCHTRLLRLVRE